MIHDAHRTLTWHDHKHPSKAKLLTPFPRYMDIHYTVFTRIEIVAAAAASGL